MMGDEQRRSTATVERDGYGPLASFIGKLACILGREGQSITRDMLLNDVRALRRGHPTDEPVSDAEVQDALTQINDRLSIAPGITHKGDEVKCYTPDDDGSVYKTYLDATACAYLANAFRVLSERLGATDCASDGESR
jgi:hypothetical protein